MFELQNLKAEVAKKADQWKVDANSSEINSLKSRIQELENRLGNMSNVAYQAQKAYDGLHELLALMIENPQEGFEYEVGNIKQRNQ